LDDFRDNFYKDRKSMEKNPISLTDGDTKVLRGGSFNFVKSSARTSYRYYSLRNHKDGTIGFRIVLS
jgi:formylglycine-generating enzyme required for sulfatase activity